MKAIAGKIPTPLSQSEAVALASHEKNLQAAYRPFRRFVLTLTEIRNDKRHLYRIFGTFDGYMEALPKRMGWDDEFSQNYLGRIRRAMNYREKLGVLVPRGTVLPETEKQIRALSAAQTPEQAAEVWQEATATEAGGGPKASAKRIEELIAKTGDVAEDGEKQRPIDKLMLKWAAWIQRLRNSITKQFGREKVGEAMGCFDDAWDKVTELAEQE